MDIITVISQWYKPSQEASPEVVAALVAGAISLVVALVNTTLLYLQHRESGQLARRAERMIRRLLKRSTGKYFPFRQVRHHIGGFSDDELRRMLVRAGALRFSDNNMTEYWALYDDLNRLEKKEFTSVLVPVLESTPQYKLFSNSNQSEKK